MPRIASALLVAGLLVATAAAFAVTERLKLVRSPITGTNLDRGLFSPVCGCETSSVEIAFRLRRPRPDHAHRGRRGRSERPDADRRRTVSGRPGDCAGWNGRDDSGRSCPRAPTSHACISTTSGARSSCPTRCGSTRPRPGLLRRVVPARVLPGRRRAPRQDRRPLHAEQKAGVRLLVDNTPRVIARGRQPRARSSGTAASTAAASAGLYDLSIVATDGPATTVRPPARSRCGSGTSSWRGTRSACAPAGGSAFACARTRVVHVAARAAPRRTATPGPLVVRAPNRPGRYVLVVEANGRRDRAEVRVERRRAVELARIGGMAAAAGLGVLLCALAQRPPRRPRGLGRGGASLLYYLEPVSRLPPARRGRHRPGDRRRGLGCALPAVAVARRLGALALAPARIPIDLGGEERSCSCRSTSSWSAQRSRSRGSSGAATRARASSACSPGRSPLSSAGSGCRWRGRTTSGRPSRARRLLPALRAARRRRSRACRGAAVGRRARWARGHGGRLRRRRRLPVADARRVLEPQGDRRQRVRALLPRQLVLLGPSSVYGRFLVVAILVLVVVAVFAPSAHRRRVAARDRDRLDGLVLSFSQSSFGALIAGLLAVAAVLWGARGLVPLGVAVVSLLASRSPRRRCAPRCAGSRPGHRRPRPWSRTARESRRAPGRRRRARWLPAVVRGADGVDRRREAGAASHTTPVTVAAETGIVRLALFGWLLAVPLATNFRRASANFADRASRIVRGLVVLAIAVHSLFYNAFFEDPMTWGALGLARSSPAAGWR